MPLPPLSFSGGTTASGATAGAYGVSTGSGAWIVNFKGTQDAAASAAPSFNWWLIGGAAVVAILMLKKRKG